MRWLADSAWYFCVTFVRGVSAEELGARLAADPAGPVVLTTPRSVEGLLGDPNVGLARLGAANGWAFAAEYGESRGSVQDGLVRLAGGGEAVNLDPQASHPPPMFSCAAGGELLCSFGLAEEWRRWGSRPDLLNGALESAGVLMPDGSVLEVSAQRHSRRVAMSLGVIERHFGLSLPRDLLVKELPTVVVSGSPDLSRI